MNWHETKSHVHMIIITIQMKSLSKEICTKFQKHWITIAHPKFSKEIKVAY